MSGAAGLLQGLEVVDESTCLFAEYWASLPKVDLIPPREAFRPEEVPRLLPNIVIHELVSPEIVRLRLVGSAVVDDYGQDITGRNYLDFVERERRPKASRSLFLTCAHPAGMLALLRSVSRAGRVMLRESIALPFRGDAGVPNLAYAYSSSARERAYSSLDLDELQVMSVARRDYFDIGAGVPDFRD